jgi:SAM-dependent methyltransferase
MVGYGVGGSVGGSMLMQKGPDPVPPILRNKPYEAGSVFTPDGIPRQARRQKMLNGSYAAVRRSHTLSNRMNSNAGAAFNSRQPILALAALLLAFCTVPGRAQEVTYLAAAGAPAKSFPAPQRAVADIVSPTRSTEKQRDGMDESGQIVRLMELKAGMTVGDVGAGSGYHTVRLSPVLGVQGQVIAQDVRRDYLQQLDQRIRRLKLRNVQLGLGQPHDPRLPPGSLDAAILVHMYHEVAQPYAFLYNLVPALKPGARVGIVDLDRPTAQHGTPLDLLRCELAAVGYRQTAVHMLRGDGAYLAIFSPPGDHDRKRPEAIKPCEITQR